MTFIPLFGPITKLSLSFVTFRVSRFPASHLTHEIVKLGLQNTLNMSKTTRVYFGVLHKKAGVPLEDNEAWIHPIKAISVKKDKPGVPRLEEVYNSGNEPSDEDELRAYRSKCGIPLSTQGEAEQSSTQPPPPQPFLEEDPVSPSTTLED